MIFVPRDVAKATKVYDAVMDGIKSGTRTAKVANKKLVSASEKLAIAWVKTLNETTARYTVGAAFSTTGKRVFIKMVRY